MLVSFQLTMPNIGSWNGKWSGESKKYYVIQNLPKTWVGKQDHFKTLIEKGNDYWHYNFGDGWSANVRAEIVYAPEARKRKKISSGFCGYEWMIDTIKYYGKIMDTLQLKRHLEPKQETETI